MRCRECGCTDADCSSCIEATGEPCWWVEPDLCSRCAPRAAAVGDVYTTKGGRTYIVAELWPNHQGCVLEAMPRRLHPGARIANDLHRRFTELVPPAFERVE